MGVDYVYGKKKNGFRVDKFLIARNEFEKKIIESIKV